MDFLSNSIEANNYGKERERILTNKQLVVFKVVVINFFRVVLGISSLVEVLSRCFLVL